MNIKRGDIVQISKGKDKGKKGKVVKTYHENNKVMLEGLNLFKRHVRPKRQGEKGEIVKVSRPIHVSNVFLHCQNCNRGVRTGIVRDKKIKSRHCKKCGGEI